MARLEFCVGSADTPTGKIRTANGHPDPFPARWLAVGNEMYGQWQLGNMPLDQYIRKHNSVVGVAAVGPRDEGILAGSAGHWDLISEHNCRKELPEDRNALTVSVVNPEPRADEVRLELRVPAFSVALVRFELE